MPPRKRRRDRYGLDDDRSGDRSIPVWVQNGLAVVLGLIAAVVTFRRGMCGMSLVGKVESLWRYPIKSMRGEELEEAFVRAGQAIHLVDHDDIDLACPDVSQ